MTNNFTQHVFTELAKAGILFLIMGIALYVLWVKVETADEEQKQEIEALRKETAECRSDQLRLTLDQLQKNTDVISRNTDVINKLIK